MTHFPSLVDDYIAFNAGGPWPWPSDIMLISSLFLPFYFARRSKFCNGSAPTDKMKVNGILLIVSLYIYCIVGEVESIKISPRVDLIKCLIASTVSSGLRVFIKSNYWNGVIFSCYFRKEWCCEKLKGF